MTIPERGCLRSPSTRSPGPGKWNRQGSCLQQQSKLGHFCALQCHLLSHWVRHGHPQGSLSLLGETLQCTDCVILSLQVCRLQKNYKFTCLQWSPASQLQAGGVSAHLGNGFQSLPIAGLVRARREAGGEQKYRSQPTSSSAKAQFLEYADEFPSGYNFGPMSHFVISRQCL